MLSTYPQVHSSDVEEFRQGVADVLRPYRLDPHPHRPRESMLFNAVSLGDIALCYLTHGMGVRVRHAPLDSFLVVTISLAGSMVVRDGRSATQHDERLAAVIDPDSDQDMFFDPRAELLVLRVERRAAEAELHRMLGRPPTSRLRLDTSLDMTTPEARSWFSVLRTLCADLEGPRGMSHVALQETVQRFVITQMLTTINHSASDELAALDAGMFENARPRAIRRADQLINDHAREPLTVTDIAEAAGLSVRSLQDGFRKHLNTTPTERLRQARLAGVHAELIASDPAHQTVSGIVADWGIGHVGRFAQTYKQTFGEMPSQTLRR